ncbi:MAG: DegT/DnrJ/EryC1/StrS aminotransferase family protein [Actinobacteria bacterium]|nr:DegT/DnrJ/EryC1/StrS aminotransferase family protein [Actinomycetota bacterium]
MSQERFIPFALPDVGADEAEAVASVVRSGWVTSGPEMKAFEDDFVGFLGGGVQSIALNSATAALHLALEAIGIGPGDEVIVPTWTFTATAEVVRHLGARPVIVDVDAETLNLSLDAVEAALSPATRAVVPVHFAGLPLDVASLRALLPGSVRIVEDAAHALPAVRDGETVGEARFSDAVAFSFYATKTVTTGEGGMLTTRDSEIAARAKVMRLHGIDRDAFDRYTSTKPAWAYDVVAAGFKYNMPDTAAAMGRVQLGKAELMRSRRESIAARYAAELEGLGLTLPEAAPAGVTHSWHLFVVRLSAEGIGRDAFVDGMNRYGVGTSVHFIPLHEHTYWRRYVADPAKTLPVACAEAPFAVSLPIYSSMSDDQVDHVCEAVRSVLS